MIVYQENKTQFLSDVRNDMIETKIAARVLEKLHRHTSESELRSWMNSMQYMYKVMEYEEIPNESKVAIEYQLPNTSKRIDFLICGEDDTHRETAVIVELKQWDYLEKCPEQEAIVKTYLNGRLVKHDHPSYQAYSYQSFIEEYNESVRKHDILLKPCSYLHNYRLKNNDDLIDPIYDLYIQKAPVFTRGDTEKLAKFIARYVKRANGEVIYHIEKGKIRPSKSIQDSLSSLLKGNKEFTLLDEQKVIYEEAILLAKKESEKKKVYIIHGGPGTGKTVLAINMLVGILNLNQNVLYVTKNSAPREVYKKKLNDGNYRKAYIDNLFKGSGVFVDSLKNDFDCLIVDEAHRLNAKSGMFQNKGENQIKEIINAAKLSIFFVDDHQIVTTKDIGTSEEIKKWAKKLDAEIIEDKLYSQFRCNGSDSYINWLDNVLNIDSEALDYFSDDFDFEILDTPHEVFNKILEKNKINNKSRMVAGYCWDWISSGKNDTNVHDIVINDFAKSWNLGSTSTWAIDEKSVNEIGCIHTCQGLEFDYVGVIIGDDMRYEAGIVTDFSKRAKTDQSLKGLKKLYLSDPSKAKKTADNIIKNTYRTLLTRGQKGCYVYCTDHKLSEYLKRRLKASKQHGTL